MSEFELARASKQTFRIRRVKTVVREIDRRTTSGQERLLTLSRSRGLVPRSDITDRVHSAISLSNYKLCRPGEIVMNRMQAWSGMLSLSRHEGLVSPDYAILAPVGDVNVRFLAYRLVAPDMVAQYVESSRGIGSGFNRLYFETMGRLSTTVPDYEIQDAIVRFLDHAELRIAKAIAGKNDLLMRMLELRRAKVAAGILGSDASIRVHNGLPFEVPSSWGIEPFWAVAPEVSISGHAEKELLSVYLDRGVIRYSESGGQVHKPSLDLSAYQLVQPHNLVLNNQQAWRGSVGVSLHEGIISPAYVVCSLDDRFDTDFANLLFRSPVMVSQFELASRGVGSIQRQLHRPSLRVLRVPIPPRAEQKRIAAQLTAETKGIDAAVQSLREEIALLKEYRTRLISDVVTGKIDVRKEAAKLPDIDPSELAAVLAGGTTGADESEEGADGDD